MIELFGAGLAQGLEFYRGAMACALRVGLGSHWLLLVSLMHCSNNFSGVSELVGLKFVGQLASFFKVLYEGWLFFCVLNHFVQYSLSGHVNVYCFQHFLIPVL